MIFILVFSFISRSLRVVSTTGYIIKWLNNMDSKNFKNLMFLSNLESICHQTLTRPNRTISFKNISITLKSVTLFHNYQYNKAMLMQSQDNLYTFLSVSSLREGHGSSFRLSADDIIVVFHNPLSAVIKCSLISIAQLIVVCRY